VTFIILGIANDEPLSGTQVISILNQTQSLSTLKSAGVTANGFVTPGKETITSSVE